MMPKTATQAVSAFREKCRNRTAYRKLARYSHCSDQAGPFRGLVSDHPRMSIDLGMGIIVNAHSMISTVLCQGVFPMSGKLEQSPK